MVKEEVPINEENCLDVDSSEDNVSNEENKHLRNEYRRLKMEEFQKRIDEIKEKLIIEETHLQDAEMKLTTDVNDCKFKSQSDLSKNADESCDEKNSSENSFYFSASNHSMCSLRSNSTAASTYYNFTAFVNNFEQNQTPEERLTLLQLHSRTQITLNMMKHSLVELDSRCSKELELVETSLQQLEKLAKEFNVNIESGKNRDDDRLKALELYSVSNLEFDKGQADGSIDNFIFEWKNENTLVNYEESSNSNSSNDF